MLLRSSSFAEKDGKQMLKKISLLNDEMFRVVSLLEALVYLSSSETAAIGNNEETDSNTKETRKLKGDASALRQRLNQL